MLQYTLESFCEGRSIGYTVKPYMGGEVDGPDCGKPPVPWDITCEPDEVFRDHVKKVEVPHSSFVMVSKLQDNHMIMTYSLLVIIIKTPSLFYTSDVMPGSAVMCSPNSMFPVSSPCIRHYICTIDSQCSSPYTGHSTCSIYSQCSSPMQDILPVHFIANVLASIQDILPVPLIANGLAPATVLYFTSNFIQLKFSGFLI